MLRLSVALVCAASLSLGVAHATNVLIGERARQPLSALIGIPNAALRTDGQQLQMQLLHSNAFVGSFADDEILFLDGETTELALRWQQPVTDCLSVSARVPFIAHGGGSFDSSIETWHDWFGFPNGGRENFPRDQLRFEYTTEEGTHALDSATGGLGDVSLWLRGNLGCNTSDASLPWRIGLKLPTGDEQQWLGSGGTDVWADIQSRVYQPAQNLFVAASLGVLLPGETEVLPSLAPVALYGAVGMRLALTPRIIAHVALDWHSPLFDSELEELGRVAGQLTTGLLIAATRSTQVEIQITEDVLIDTASDIALRLAVTTRFSDR